MNGNSTIAQFEGTELSIDAEVSYINFGQYIDEQR